MLGNLFKKKKKYSSITNAFGICALIIVILFIILLLFRGVKYDNVVINSNSSSIIISDDLPLNDKVGMNIKKNDDGIVGYFKFSIENKRGINTKAFVYLEKSFDSTIPDKYIKVFLTDGDDKPCKLFKNNIVPNYGELLYDSYYSGGKIIFEDILSRYEKKEFILRVWLSDFYPLGYKGESFILNVGVHSV